MSHLRATDFENQLNTIPPRPLPYFTRLVLTWNERRKTRQNLSRLDAHMLRDIGIDRAMADAETGKPFWRE